jgi:hypothetical protein
MTTRAARRVARLDKKRREALPLFAATGTIDAVVPLPSEDKVEANYVWMECNVRAQQLRMWQAGIREWAYYRRLCETVMTMDEIRAGESYCRRVYPLGAHFSYRVTFWLKRARDLGLEPDPWATLQRLHQGTGLKEIAG